MPPKPKKPKAKPNPATTPSIPTTKPSTPEVSTPTNRNETIMSDRLLHLQLTLGSKDKELTEVVRKTRAIVRDNIVKDADINLIVEEGKDLKDKHAASMSLIDLEGGSVVDDLDYQIALLREEALQLGRQVEHLGDLEGQNVRLNSEYGGIMTTLTTDENDFNETIRNIKASVIDQQDKLASSFKKDLLSMDTSFRSSAFQMLSDDKKDALLKNKVLQEEIFMQVVGLANLEERIALESSELENASEMHKGLIGKSQGAGESIAKLRRTLHGYETRISDMDVTIVTLNDEEELLNVRKGILTYNVHDAAIEGNRMRSMVDTFSECGMKWKNRHDTLLEMINEEKRRKTIAIKHEAYVTSTLPPSAPIDMNGTREWTDTMMRKVRSRKEVDSTEFYEEFHDAVKAWRREDGVASRPNTTKSRFSSRPNTAIQSNPGLLSDMDMDMDMDMGVDMGVGKEKEKDIVNTDATPTTPKRRQTHVVKALKISPPTQQTLDVLELVNDAINGNESNSSVLPMLTRKGKRTVTDEDDDYVNRKKEERRIIEESRLLFLKLMNESKADEDDVVEVVDEDKIDTFRSRDSVIDWIDNYKVSKRIDIGSTGLDSTMNSSLKRVSVGISNLAKTKNKVVSKMMMSMMTAPPPAFGSSAGAGAGAGAGGGSETMTLTKKRMSLVDKSRMSKTKDRSAVRMKGPNSNSNFDDSRYVGRAGRDAVAVTSGFSAGTTLW